MGNLSRPFGLVALSWLCACGATNTGNPTQNDGPGGLGILRSELERDATPDITDADASAFGRSGRDFAFDFYRAAIEDDENLVFSPYSIRVALGMVYAGSAGTTKQELMDGMHFELPEPSLHAAFNRGALALAGREDEVVPAEGAPGGELRLNVINALFAQEGRSFKSSYLDVLATHYDTGVYEADFQGAPEEQRATINGWVEDQTNRRIEDLLPEGSIDPSTVFVLLNAVYFKGSWLTPFNKDQTVADTFHAPGGDVQVPTMHGYGESYFAGAGYRALSLSYVAQNLGMLLLLPDEGRFDEIEAQLDADLFDEAIAGLSRHSVQVRMPKFTFDAEVALKDVLKALGVQDLFQAGVCDLSGMTGAPGDIYVTGAFHKAFIGVDEEGTEAAAATAIVGGEVSAPPPAEFFADRPFIFAIYDQPTGEVLFLGRVMDPR